MNRENKCQSVTLGIAACLFAWRHYTDEGGELSSPDVGIDVGIDVGSWDLLIVIVIIIVISNQITIMITMRRIRRPSYMLDQTEFDCACHSRPSTVDVEFAIDALGMGADGTQSNYKFLGDLWPGQFGFEQAQKFKFTVTKMAGPKIERVRVERV